MADDASPVSSIPEGIIAYSPLHDRLVLQPMDSVHPPQEMMIPLHLMNDVMFAAFPRSDYNTYFLMDQGHRGRTIELSPADVNLKDSLEVQLRWLFSGKWGEPELGSYVIDAQDAHVTLAIPIWAHYAGFHFDTKRYVLYYDRLKVVGVAQELPHLNRIAMFNKMSKMFQRVPREDTGGFKRIIPTHLEQLVQ